jgi:hypothetical protein
MAMKVASKPNKAAYYSWLIESGIFNFVRAG